MACAAEGVSAQDHAARLSGAVELGWDAAAYPSYALCRIARARRPRGKPDHRHHRQPERQGRRKRGASIDPSGYDAGKKIKGKKRHIVVDTLGLLLMAVVHPADIQDRDGGVLVLSTLFG